MEYNEIKGLDKKASRMVFGTATPLLFAAASKDAADADVNAAFELLDEVFAAGVNTFDCAAHYGEEIMGKWMESRRNRDKCIIITKGAHPNSFRNRVTDYDILSDIHDSLCKLKTNCIDVYMLHRDNTDVEVDSIVEVLNKLKDEGKIKVFGASNWTHGRIEAANEYAVKHGLTPFTVSSPNFGLAEQVNDPWQCDAHFGNGCVTISGPENKTAREWYLENNLSIFAYSSLARGFFSGAFKSSEPERAKDIMDGPGMIGYYCERNIERLRRCEVIAEKYHCTVAQVALAWLYNHPLKAFALSSPTTKKQLEENIFAMNIKLTRGECKWLDIEDK